jgi:formate hydrogenlyase subunit 3/multisubunit Na+/H+ antiporter MnhD subunit
MISDFLASLWETLRADAETFSMVVTAAATIALGFFTWVLARETKRLSRATAQAHVVATLEPNPWSVKHYDLVVANTGNAAAHDVVVSFTPDLAC